MHARSSGWARVAAALAGWLTAAVVAGVALRPLWGAAALLCVATAALAWAVGPVALVLPVLAAVVAWLGLDLLRHPDESSGEDPNAVYLLVIVPLLLAAEVGGAAGLRFCARGRTAAG